MSVEQGLKLHSLDEQGNVILLPAFIAAFNDGFKEIAHAVFVETLSIARLVPAADEIRGGAEAREQAIAPYASQLTEMIRITSSKCCEDCGCCQEQDLLQRLLDTARTMTAENNRLTEIVTQLESIAQ